MPRPINNRLPKKNSTEEKLRATPFSQIDSLLAEEKLIRQSVWRRLTEAKIIEELLTKPEFNHIANELKAGLSCYYKTENSDQLYKISSDGQGLKLEINEELSDSLGSHHAETLKNLIQAGIEGYGGIYMHLKGLGSKGDTKETNEKILDSHVSAKAISKNEPKK